jgi:hypothetical protein
MVVNDKRPKNVDEESQEGAEMKTPEWILESVRHCIHSNIRCATKDLSPDYYCSLSKNACVALMDGACSRREPFPENLNT